MQLGREEGVQQGRIDIAHKMLAKGHSVDDIAEMTGLSVDEVCNLQND